MLDTVDNKYNYLIHAINMHRKRRINNVVDLFDTSIEIDVEPFIDRNSKRARLEQELKVLYQRKAALK
jgi:hypothetical protein